uniref:Non-specific serine/threonine protein kinase n=1 Tax=Noctiluca scintillans TaxID=2966 RepID=A0A7S0ZZ78_NOCSC|mmetsp:Transcript_24336/g.63943  ORF Transcript_24336/g.63943 Transcript_24336/m.63943 type:complete len:491 (+) Transcript_24336:37-1509(+)
MGCVWSTPAPDDPPSPRPAPRGAAKEEAVKQQADDVGRSRFIMDNPGDVHEVYDMEKRRIGEGAVRAINKETGLLVSIRCLPKSEQKQVAVMKLMDHPNIIKLYETYQDSRNMYLVFEYVAGGALFDRIIETGQLTEAQAAGIMKQIIQAVFYMHEHRVCHGDLGPESFHFLTRDPIPENVLKLVDFGQSCEFEPGQKFTTRTGQTIYVAPEVSEVRNDSAIDLWACGIIMHSLLCGYQPFTGGRDHVIREKVRIGNFHFDATHWKDVSKDAQHLVRQLLKPDPHSRFTAEQALNHDWIARQAPRVRDVPLPPSLLDNLRTFQKMNVLKKAALHVIAGKLNDENMRKLREIFMALDARGDGLLTVTEIKEGLQRARMDDVAADVDFLKEDLDHGGVVDYTEFLAAAVEKHTYLQEDLCRAAFRVFDRDGDGKISTDELAMVLDTENIPSTTAEHVTELMDEIDLHHKGSIDFCDFMHMMGGGDSGARSSS